MTDDFQDDDQNEDRNIRNLREKAKQADSLQSEVESMRKQLADAERERAFFKSGIDAADPKMKYFFDGYKGELTPEAIKAEASAAGFLNAAPAVPQEHFDAFDRAGQAAAGAQAQAADTGHLSELRQGMSPEEIGAVLMKHGQPVSDIGPISPEFQSIVS